MPKGRGGALQRKEKGGIQAALEKRKKKQQESPGGGRGATRNVFAYREKSL